MEFEDIEFEDIEHEAYWLGANGCEYMAFRGTCEIFVYPTWEHPDAPREVIRANIIIQSKEDFMRALNEGKTFKVIYSD